ncbi:MAG TPA: FAD-dependent oxidoreductase [Bryobacteraceae bacterium]|nr:FAD-dependent oxidoreductase [Bryobacteraceae bacterium]
MRRTLLAIAFTAASGLAAAATDVLIIGAGIAGLSTALDAARSGASVTVADISTVAGGHAVLSNGAVCLIATPLQERNRIADSPALARQDFLARGGDADEVWVERYTRDSRKKVYDWLAEIGVVFEALVKPAGNSVPRLHLAKGKGWGLVGPMYRECLRHPSIKFLWSTRADRLIVREGAVRGAMATDLRTGRRRELLARSTVVATGGFGSNLELVLKNWPAELPRPDRLLLGAAHSANGSGHELVTRAGGTLARMDHHWNYVLGLPDPRDRTRRRGLAAFNFRSIWVNAEGRRFTREFGDEKQSLAALLRQPGGSYWAVFDEKARRAFSITLAGWESFDEVSRLVYDTPGVVVRAASIAELAARTNMNAETLRNTVDRYSQLAAEGVDRDFQAFGPRTTPKPEPFDTTKLYAAQFFPITRKSMGGVVVDGDCRVLSHAGKPIPGLFAVGEVTGFAGINGRAALEGTFLGPAIFMGRIAATAIASNLRPRAVTPLELPAAAPAAAFENQQCVSCHPVTEDIMRNRPGYWHYEQSHAKTIARGYACAKCHSDLHPYRANSHRLDRRAMLHHCIACHGVQ